MRLTILAGLFLLIPAAHAADFQDEFEARRQRQDLKIEQGVATGAIDEREAKRLQRQQDRNRRREERALSNGESAAKQYQQLQRHNRKLEQRIERANR